MSEVSPLLEVQNLKMYYPVAGGRRGAMVRAVDGVSFTIAPGQTFGLVGESGCGKTTVGQCVLRIHAPVGGRVLFGGRDIAALSTREFAPLRRRLQLIFQDPYGSLDPRQSAASMLSEAVQADGVERRRSEVEARVAELLDAVELSTDLGSRFPHEMSGGQRQRLAIARALACNPDLIVCDEPVSALDVSIQAQIINLFKTLQRRLGLTYLFVAHDLAVVRHISHQIGVMYLGKLVEVTDARTLYARPLHPYTRALLSAIPLTDYHQERQRTRVVLKGEVPSPINVPSGCPFHTRCHLATEICRVEMPAMQTHAGHSLACHHVAVDDAKGSV